MNKKQFSIFSIIIIVTVSMLFTGCSSKNKASTENESKLINKIQIDNKKNDIVLTINSTANLKTMYATIDEYNDSDEVDKIVKGTIENIEYIYPEAGNALSILTVNVSETIKGEHTDEVVVYEDGGLISFEEFEQKNSAQLNKKNIDKAKISEQLKKNKLVEFTFEKAPLSKKGQEVLLYLFENPNINEIKGSYMLVSSHYGKYVLDKKSKTYKRHKIEFKDEKEKGTLSNFATNFEYEISEITMDDKLKNLKEYK